MGPVDKDDAKKEEGEAPEDPPVVKTLKEIDDRYLALEREYEKELAKLELEYRNKKKPFLEERKAILANDEDKSTADFRAEFWLKALNRAPEILDTERIQSWDEPVLRFLTDIESILLDDLDEKKGFKIVFHFAENPYFAHTELSKEFITEEMNPYIEQLAVKEIKSTEIEWKAGKDVTVEKITKKPKGGGAKKAKQKKEVEEPRESFFRDFFRSLAPGKPISQDLKNEMLESLGGGGSESDEDEDNMLEYIMEEDHSLGLVIRDQIIPFAVRFYTGEAVPEDDSRDDDSEDDDDEDDDDDEEDSDDEPKGKAKGKGKKGPKKKESGDSAEGKDTKKKEEECKQQ